MLKEKLIYCVCSKESTPFHTSLIYMTLCDLITVVLTFSKKILFDCELILFLFALKFQACLKAILQNEVLVSFENW